MTTEYTIKVENDISSEDMDYFVKSFRSYNISIIGEQEFKPINIVIKNESQEIISGVIATSVWGWVMINKFWIDKQYRHRGLGAEILGLVENEAIKNGIKKIAVYTNIDDIKDFYIINGYVVDGVLDDRPSSFTSYYLKKEKITEQSINIDSKYQICFGNEVKEEDIKLINEKINNEQNEIFGDIPFKLVKIFARDNNDKIIGGLTGYIGWEWFYINILWVDEKYRKKGLGKKLLCKAEKEALDFGVNKAFLGTTEFQAREFYEKNGYEVFSTREDLPPGYKNFSMKKILKLNLK